MAAAGVVLAVVVGGAGYALTRATPSKPIQTETKETSQPEEQKTISVVSEPASAQIETTLCGTEEPTQTAPFTCKAKLGEEVSLTAVASYVYEGSTYTFDKWEGCDRTEGAACYVMVSDTTPSPKAIYKKETTKTPSPAPKPKSQPAALCPTSNSLTCTIPITAAPTNYTLKVSFSGPKSQIPVTATYWISSDQAACTVSSHCATTPPGHVTTDQSVLVTALQPTTLKISAQGYIVTNTCVGIGCPRQKPVDQFRFAGFSSDPASRTIVFNYEFRCNWSGDPAPNCNSLL